MISIFLMALTPAKNIFQKKYFDHRFVKLLTSQSINSCL